MTARVEFGFIVVFVAFSNTSHCGDVLCKEILIHGQQYKIGDVVVTKASDRDTLEVGVIQELLCWNIRSRVWNIRGSVVDHGCSKMCPF